jgi:ABC-type microcin C transport system permease subunit YejB
VTLIAAAIAETIGMIALLVSFFGGGQFYVIIFGVVGLVVILSSYPRRAAWEKIVEYYAATMPG